MRALLIVGLGCLLAGTGLAQRGGGGHAGGGGGFRGGGSMGGGSFHGSTGGGFRGGSGGSFHGGSGFVGNFGHGGFNSGFHGGFHTGFRGGFGFGFGGYWPYYGLGVTYWPSDYYDYGYPYGGYYGGYDYPAYQSSPNVTVVYPQQAQAQPQMTNAYYVQQRANPVVHDYDEYGQEVKRPSGNSQAESSAPSASPIYLIAMKDGIIRAAVAYWVNGATVHYVTMEHQEKQAPLAQIDRSLSQQLNRERHVHFSLPQQ
jgi:hypothetical protein